ncbi:MAG: hypothetical protein J2P37_19600 [Ktedonobacteraceae bacterium]|nr:hypothetical protein [Ktedonobacteraceae bacterium]
MNHLPAQKYPRCWKRASRTIRRLAGGHCERCGCACNNLSVHHIGTPFANGKPGDPHDKHDLRRENLTALCFACHDEIEHIRAISEAVKQQKQKRAAQLVAHRALGIGTGLIPVVDQTISTQPKES